MSRVLSRLQGRRTKARKNRAIARVIDRTTSPTMRDELLILAQRSSSGLSR